MKFPPLSSQSARPLLGLAVVLVVAGCGSGYVEKTDPNNSSGLARRAKQNAKNDGEAMPAEAMPSGK